MKSQRQRCNPCNPFVTLLLVLVWSGGARAEPCASAPYRAFDFWVGSWEVRLADGRLAGHNRIEISEQGCLITERWTGAEGGSGSSMNFYDALRDRWRQVWVSPGVIIDIEGIPGPGTMRLEGTIVYAASEATAATAARAGERLPFRGTWTVEADGTVRQRFEEQREGTWATWFDGVYRKDVE